MEPKQIVSLMEPVRLLKETFRQYLSYAITTNASTETLNKLHHCHAHDYNAFPYMKQLLSEIMDNSGNPEMFKQTSPSTDILIKDGMDRESAMALTLNVFSYTVDTLSTFLPNVYFGDFKGYDIDFINEYDIMILPPLNMKRL